MATAKDGCDPGGHCWTAPCRHLSQGHSFPIRGTQSSDWACPRLQFPSHHSLAMDLLTWAQTPTFRVTSWPSLSIAPMAPPGHPKTGSDPGYCLLTRAQICCSLVITISGFSKAQGDHMQLILNKRRKKKYRQLLIKHTASNLNFYLFPFKVYRFPSKFSTKIYYYLMEL